jgi:predicted thioesterase
MQNVSLGISGHAEWNVTDEMTAARIGSGLVAVFSTPMLVALMEAAAVNALEGRLPDGQTSVGTQINLAHLAATPVDLTVRSTATLIELDGRTLTFAIEAWDEHDRIGDATHVRVVVDRERFEARAAQKLAGSDA